MPELSFITKTGSEISGVFDDLAKLRIAVFRDFPYLYEGSAAYEKEYLQTYANAERALLFAVYDGEEMVGATTCIPLSDEMPEIQKPLLDAGYKVNEIFYFGESILLQSYRGLGLGHKFFDVREAHARSFNQYKISCFCSVIRPDDHPLKPINYRPNDAFWLKRGYRKLPDLNAELSWQDIDESQSTVKRLVFWLKELD